MRDNKLVITAEPKTFHFYLPKDAGIHHSFEASNLFYHKTW